MSDFKTERVLSPGSPTGCSPKSACHGPRLRARWGAPPGATRTVLKSMRSTQVSSGIRRPNECGHLMSSHLVILLNWMIAQSEEHDQVTRWPNHQIHRAMLTDFHF